MRLITALLVLLAALAAAPQPGCASESLRAEHISDLTGAGGVPFNHPTDVAVAGGRLYVLDGLNRRVAVFDLNGGFLFEFGGGFRRPIGLCADRRGSIYVTDAESAKVKIFGPDGASAGEFTVHPAGKNEKPDMTDCAVSPRDEVFIVDNDNHRIHVYDRGGRRLRGWGGFGENMNEFRYPATITLDEHSVAYVVDVINNQVKSFTPAGEPLVSLGGWGITAGKLYRPKGVLLSGHKLYVSDSYTGTIQTFSTDGLFLGTLSDAAGGRLRFVTPTNMALAGQRLYVVEQFKSRVSVWKIRGVKD